MKTFLTKYKIPLFVLLGLLLALIIAGVSAFVGVKYYYPEFVAVDTHLQTAIDSITGADEEAAAAAAVRNAYLRTITINGEEATIDLLADTHTWFDSPMMSTEIDNTFVFGDFSGYDIVFEGQAVSEGSEVSVSLDELSIARGLELKVTDQASGETVYYYIRTLHSQYSGVAVGQGEGEGYYYFNSENTIYKMDMSGNIVFYKETPGDIVRDFKQTIVDGTVYYSYLEEASAKVTNSSSNMIGIVMNADYQVIDVIETLSTADGMPENAYLDDHEFVILGENHYIITSYAQMEVYNIPTEVAADNTAFVAAAVVQEIKDGELLFQWCSADYEELYAYSIRVTRLADDSVTNAIDYMHMNTVAIDPNDGNYVLSFRSLSALIKIDSTTGDIIWILGGEGDEFNLTEEQQMSYQHFPYFFDENTITVFDNGNDYEQTRILEYVLDEETKTLTSFTAYEIEDWYASAMGSALRLSADEPLYLVCWGQVDSNGILFSEINFETGEVLFQLMDITSTSDYFVASYRVYKFDS